MKIYEVCLFKANRTDRVIASVCANGEEEAMKKALDQKKILVRSEDWMEYTEVTATFTHFVEDNVWTHIGKLNQVVCETAGAFGT